MTKNFILTGYRSHIRPIVRIVKSRKIRWAGHAAKDGGDKECI
jgi:hypothetical protein